MELGEFGGRDSLGEVERGEKHDQNILYKNFFQLQKGKNSHTIITNKNMFYSYKIG